MYDFADCTPTSNLEVVYSSIVTRSTHGTSCFCVKQRRCWTEFWFWDEKYARLPLPMPHKKRAGTQTTTCSIWVQNLTWEIQWFRSSWRPGFLLRHSSLDSLGLRCSAREGLACGWRQGSQLRVSSRSSPAHQQAWKSETHGDSDLSTSVTQSEAAHSTNSKGWAKQARQLVPVIDASISWALLLLPFEGVGQDLCGRLNSPALSDKDCISESQTWLHVCVWAWEREY